MRGETSQAPSCLLRSAVEMAALIVSRRISSSELVSAHLDRITQINPALNAAILVLGETALATAQERDRQLARGEVQGPLHGVPFSIKDSIDVRGTVCTAGTLGRHDAAPAEQDATLVARLREAGAIPLAKTNLPDLLFAFETDNLLFGRTNNPYDAARTPGGSSGGESALIAACGSPLGLGSDAFGSVRLPAAFCGIASIKPTSGRLPRTGHVPPAGGWIEALWQIGPMARRVQDLDLAMKLLAYPDDSDFTAPPVPLMPAPQLNAMRIAFFTDNGIVPATPPVAEAVKRAAQILCEAGAQVDECRPPASEQAYELEMALVGADGAQGIESYLREAGSQRVHPYHDHFLDQFRAFRTDAGGLARRWEQWDRYRADLRRFFAQYDAVLGPVYPEIALRHGESQGKTKFLGFSYTMAWNLAGAPAATVRVAEHAGLPVNVQVAARPWADMTALAICRAIEERTGGWRAAES